MKAEKLNEEKKENLNIDATGLSGTADNMNVNNSNSGNTELGDLTVNGTANLTFNGSVS